MMAGILLFGFSDRNSGDSWSLLSKADLFQHDRGFHAVRRGQRIQLQAFGVLGGPLFRDEKLVQVGHVLSPSG
jgi:hypothetical protein